MTLHAPSALQEFQWERQPEAERLVRELVDGFLAKNAFARELARRMKDDTGTRFHDWIDTVVVPAGDAAALVGRMQTVGYEKFHDRGGEQLWVNRLGMFPRVGVKPGSNVTEVHVKVDSVVDFADVWRLQER